MAKNKTDAARTGRVFVQTAAAQVPELDRWRQITEEEVQLVAEMTRRNELSGGTPVVREFEEAWRAWVGSRYCVTVINGTAALHSAFFGLGVGPGDEVICPANTWICTISAAVMLGAKPVFCDIDPDSLQIDSEDLERRITDKTVCVCPVHLWGNVCDMDAVMAVAGAHDIPVVEDCSHAHGAKYKGKITGSIGVAGCWSLQGSKPVSGGEGGVMTTDDVDLFERACLVGQVNRVEGIDLVSPKYEELQPLGLGGKFRAHPLAIGIASVQFRKLPELNKRRGAYIEAVEAGLADIPGLRPVKVYQGAERGGYYMFPVIHEPEQMAGVATADYVKALNEAGLKAHGTPYQNLHEMPLFAKGFDMYTRNRGPLCASEGYNGYKKGDFPKAELAFERTIFLPLLSDPIPNAASIVLESLRVTADRLASGAE
ncbi:MAG TPA: DegT/DnrJ/EryC1/StrS family aminotransferase [Candidatus Hydrogenedentes bacterium]|nr:DegT/DnrJ/EryC1/StrS family aminotransferase [Candidatus Hydrogenedentota bacterium]